MVVRRKKQKEEGKQNGNINGDELMTVAKRQRTPSEETQAFKKFAIETHNAVNGDNNDNSKSMECGTQRINMATELSGTILRSLTIAPDVSGVRCIAVHPQERELVIARENGSLVSFRIVRFQNVPHFQMLRSTGGCANRTITRLRYLPLLTGRRRGAAASVPRLLASHLSGQLVIYCGETLAPLHVYQRTGGAVWDFCISDYTVYAARADGSWHQLSVEYVSTSTAGGQLKDAVPELSLQRIIPKVPGADRALSVCCSNQWQMAAGTDDAGNVVAWRMPRTVAVDDSNGEANNSNSAVNKEGVTTGSRDRPQGLTDHESLWTSRLAEGIGLCCAICRSSGKAPPVVAVGTSVGDMVLFEANHGYAIRRFTHHKGPLSSIVCSESNINGDACGVLYASGWHESLRSYRCDPVGEWYPAEVKRRTHYHEVAELALLTRQQLILSGSRDATVMFSAPSSLFSSPATYLHTTCQSFAFIKKRNVILQTRGNRIEGFRADASFRRWVPLFVYKVRGKFYIRGVWSDDAMNHILFATDERAALLRFDMPDGTGGAAAPLHVYEVASLPIERGVVDCCFVNRGSNVGCYLLLDEAILHVTFEGGYSVVRTPLPKMEGQTENLSISPTRIIALQNQSDSANEGDGSATKLMIFGRYGWISLGTFVDGTINLESFTVRREGLQMVESVPLLSSPEDKDDEMIVGLISNERYIAGIGTSEPRNLPRTLPHDTRFLARLPPPSSGSGKGAGLCFLATFSRGLIYVTEETWCMLSRCTVEGAFVVCENKKLLLLLRNLEGQLMALPPCWRLRRFGN
uniref:WGS project CAEQ00000000 data, annotated contig 693 n=1 Tax=Trypanosoma congolense (strain IL3000) TaxID=1068625 RepID=F9WHS9_TRYCI|nr:unnamed protein product [Trypanosoma congolense IL3000]